MNVISHVGGVLAVMAGGMTVHAMEEASPSVIFPQARVVSASFTLRNTGDQVLSNAQLWVYAPIERTAYQRRRSLLSTHAYETQTDDRGNTILHFNISSLAPSATEVIGISTLIGFRSEPLPEMSAEAQYLRAEPLVEIDAPEFQQQAPRFTGADVRQMALTIYEWTSRHLPHRSYLRHDQGALYALQTREGDCSEHAYLFVALCRRHGIPARVMGGYRSRHGGVLNPEQYHNWAEFHDGQTWRLADPHARLFDDQAASYVALRIVGSRQSPVSPCAQFRGEGEGLQVTMNCPATGVSIYDR